MLEWCWGNTRIRLSPLFPAMLVVLLTMDVGGAVLWGLSATVVHELGHLTAMVALGRPPEQICIGWYGLRLETAVGMIGYGRIAVIALAGPLANMLCAALLFVATGVNLPFLLHLVTAGFQLLPARPLDGGQALRCFLLRYMSLPRCDELCRWITVAVLFCLAVAGISLWIFTGHNFTLLALTCYLIFCCYRCTD